MKTLTKLLRKSVKAAKNGGTHYSIPVDLPEGFRLDKEGNLVLPPKPAQCADLLHAVREARLSVQQEAGRLEKAETALENYFIENLSTQDATGIAGKVARVQIKPNPVPQVQDWDAFYKFIRRTGSFEFLQRRINKEPCQERWAEKKVVPGVTVFNAKKVSVTKL